MNNIKCLICNKNFNLQEKKPLILPKCGHTFCSSCLHSLLSKNEKFFCPEEKTEYSNIKKISDLPPNNMILKILQETEQPKKKEKKNICPKHNKILEYYCLSDNKQICALCGLFGIHKNHKITTNLELQGINKLLIEQTNKNLEYFEFSEDLGNLGLKDIVRKKLLENIKGNREYIMEFYNEIVNKLKGKILEDFDNYEKNLFGYFEGFYNKKENEKFGKFKKNYFGLKNKLEELNEKNNMKSFKYDFIYENILNLKEEIKNLNEIFETVQNIFKKINDCKFSLQYDFEEILKNIKIKSPKILDEDLKLEESQLLFQTLSDFNQKKENPSLECSLLKNIESNNISIYKDNNEFSIHNTPSKIINKSKRNISKNEKDFLKNEINFSKELIQNEFQKNDIKHEFFKTEDFKNFEFLKNEKQIKKRHEIKKNIIKTPLIKKSFISVDKTCYKSRRDSKRCNSIIKNKFLLTNNISFRSQVNLIEKKSSKKLSKKSSDNIYKTSKPEKTRKKKDIQSFKNSLTVSRKLSPILRRNSNLGNKNKITNISNFVLNKDHLIKIFEKIIESGDNIGRINFRNNTFICDVFGVIGEIFEEPFLFPFVIDLRTNNMKISKYSKFIKKELIGKNISVIL